MKITQTKITASLILNYQKHHKKSVKKIIEKLFVSQNITHSTKKLLYFSEKAIIYQNYTICDHKCDTFIQLVKSRDAKKSIKSNNIDEIKDLLSKKYMFKNIKLVDLTEDKQFDALTLKHISNIIWNEFFTHMKKLHKALKEN